MTSESNHLQQRFVLDKNGDVIDRLNPTVSRHRLPASLRLMPFSIVAMADRDRRRCVSSCPN
jgi:hypothetical protein